MRYLLDLCVNKSVTVVIEKKIRRFKMLRHNDVFIIDIQEQGIEAKDKDILLESFEGLMCNTSSLVKKAEYDVDEFAWAGQHTKGYYSLIMERQLKEKRLEQWRATFIKDGTVKMIALGQVEC
jgi:hypothetical protein